MEVETVESIYSDVLKCGCSDSEVESSGTSNSSSMQSLSSDSFSHTQQKCCLKQRFGSIFNRKHLSDVTFIVGQEKQEIHAHKVVLSVSSDVFNTMFSKKWRSQSAKIEVPDIETPAFLGLLRFLYTDEIFLTADTVIAILYAARKYDIQPLENRCVDFLIKNLCPDNAFTVLNEVRLLNIPKLNKSCLEAIDENTEAALATDAFCDVDLDTLCLILSRNTLTISEVNLFEALLRWSETECMRKCLLVKTETQQLVLKKVLPLVRFPLMSVSEFSSHVASSGLLTDKELVSLYQYFTTRSRPPANFCDTPRLSNRELIVKRFKSYRRLSYYIGDGEKWDAIHFTSSHDLDLLGYGLHGSTNGPAKYEVRLKLEDPTRAEDLRNESDVFISDGIAMTFRALFKNPIKLTALKKYTARIFIKGPNCFAGTEGSKEVTVNLFRDKKVTITFESCTVEAVPNLRTTVEKGLIPQLIFKL